MCRMVVVYQINSLKRLGEKHNVWFWVAKPCSPSLRCSANAKLRNAYMHAIRLIQKTVTVHTKCEHNVSAYETDADAHSPTDVFAAVELLNVCLMARSGWNARSCSHRSVITWQASVGICALQLSNMLLPLCCFIVIKWFCPCVSMIGLFLAFV